MTGIDEYILSTLEETAIISQKDGYSVSVVKDSVDDALYIKKQFETTKGINIYKSFLYVEHKNLPKTLRVIECGTGFVAIEEYIHGITLKAAIERQPMSVKQAIDFAVKICDALEILHNLNPPIIHRDITPSNIMLMSDGGVKLIDFDAAKEYKPDATKDTTTLGTRAYAAPEQFGYSKTDAKTDIYCLGATMYHMITGRPYENGNDVTEIYKIGGVIIKCLQFDPANRYSSASALKKDLKKNSKKPVLIIAAAAVLSVIAIFIVVQLTAPSEPVPEPIVLSSVTNEIVFHDLIITHSEDIRQDIRGDVLRLNFPAEVYTAAMVAIAYSFDATEFNISQAEKIIFNDVTSAFGNAFEEILIGETSMVLVDGRAGFIAEISMTGGTHNFEG
ncbi:MAG: serine/threonine protein kinase, partial [Clostridiales bacterium]|nr:serine/threonine protein kinase [Clostridiales bacterium]